jgi:hypothetical protein
VESLIEQNEKIVSYHIIWEEVTIQDERYGIPDFVNQQVINSSQSSLNRFVVTRKQDMNH